MGYAAVAIEEKKPYHEINSKPASYNDLIEVFGIGHIRMLLLGGTINLHMGDICRYLKFTKVVSLKALLKEYEVDDRHVTFRDGQMYAPFRTVANLLYEILRKGDPDELMKPPHLLKAEEIVQVCMMTD